MIYLYCVTGGNPLPLLPAVSVFPVFPPYAISAAGLAAIVSRVPFEEYDPEQTPGRLMDRLWVRQRSPAHETVLSTVLAQTTVVPAAFCTVLDSDEHAVLYLETHADVLQAQLDVLRDRQEYWIDVVRQGKRAQVDSVPAMLARLCPWADGVMDRRVAVWNPRLRAASWTFLVKRNQRQRFLQEARILAEESRGRRLLVDCSGPWAPSGFTLAPPVGEMLISRPA
ncbi:MAG: GvpL/GvpF family gas vesicle protein [Bryobacteraceae bacterium]|nr:GvpL/GvpF family gas vesicle protein [Bryobacteraceae bacterium]